MILNKLLKDVAQSVAGSAVVCMALFGSFNFAMYHNVRTELIGGTVIRSKVDRFFGYTELRDYPTGKIELYRGNMVTGGNLYFDLDGDRRVDSISLILGERSLKERVYLERDTCYQHNRVRFMDADRELHEQLERFGPPN